MKRVILFASLLLALTSVMPVAAQSTIDEAIKRLISHKKAAVSYTSSFDGFNPTAESVVSRRACYLEVYTFTIKKKYSSLINDVEAAMLSQKSNPACYRLEHYSPNSHEKPRALAIVYGQNAENKIEIGKYQANNYTIVNLADQSAEAAGQYRTCYAIEWSDINKTIQGRIIISYARIPSLATNIPTTPYYATQSPDNIDLSFVTDTVVALSGQYFPYDLLREGKLAFPTELFLKGEPLPIINALMGALRESDAEDQPLVASILYRVIKDAVANHLFSDAERKMLISQLERMIPAVSPNDTRYQTAIDYLRLSITILSEDVTP